MVSPELPNYRTQSKLPLIRTSHAPPLLARPPVVPRDPEPPPAVAALAPEGESPEGVGARSPGKPDAPHRHADRDAPAPARHRPEGDDRGGHVPVRLPHPDHDRLQ